MGKGSSATEGSVNKTLTAGAGGRGGSSRNRVRKSDTNECELSITTRLSIPLGTVPIRMGDSVMLSLASNGKSVDLFIGKIHHGHYTGPNQQLIEKCIITGYLYRGEVMEVRNQPTEILVTVSVTGLMK
jgi:hypothetical protein